MSSETGSTPARVEPATKNLSVSTGSVKGDTPEQAEAMFGPETVQLTLEWTEPTRDPFECIFSVERAPIGDAVHFSSFREREFRSGKTGYTVQKAHLLFHLNGGWNFCDPDMECVLEYARQQNTELDPDDYLPTQVKGVSCRLASGSTDGNCYKHYRITPAFADKVNKAYLLQYIEDYAQRPDRQEATPTRRDATAYKLLASD